MFEVAFLQMLTVGTVKFCTVFVDFEVTRNNFIYILSNV